MIYAQVFPPELPDHTVTVVLTPTALHDLLHNLAPKGRCLELQASLIDAWHEIPHEVHPDGCECCEVGP